MAKFYLLSIFSTFFCSLLFAQIKTDISNSLATKDSCKFQCFNIDSSSVILFQKPRSFGFIKDLPADAAAIVKSSFNKKSVRPWLWIGGSTLVLLLADKAVIRGVENFSRNIHLHPEEEYNNILNIYIGGKETNLLKIPRNLNTGIYEIGQGFPTLLLAGGLFIHGKTARDFRSSSTASQLAETFILMAAGTQIIKRITGRQSPSEPERPEGQWHPFPSFSKFQNETPKYDAFPSGHLATLMSTITVLSENYPEKKWIRPVGYSITGLVGFAMINNKVHWISDYPLAIGLGYVCGRVVAKRHHLIKSRTSVSTGTTGKTDFGFTFFQGKILPQLIYTF